MIAGRVLHAGSVTAPVVCLDAPLSFWGGFDPVAGVILDQAHPQAGLSLAGYVVVMPGSRGSAGTPGVVAEAIRRQTGPVAFIVTKADINLAAGALVAEALYDLGCPVVLVTDDELATFTDGQSVTITSAGEITTE